MNKFFCTVCGYSELQNKPWSEDLSPSWDICSSCGTHFGYDDFGKSKEEVMINHLNLREKWIVSGMNWYSKSTPEPESWNPREQLKNII